MESQTIQLEAFHTPLHGAKILYCLPKGLSLTKYPPWSEWIQKLRDPFRKRIRITNQMFPLSLSTGGTMYDATFHPSTGQDWTLILTYITYAPKPLFVVVENLPIPDGLWQKLPQGTTLLHLTSHPVVRLHPYDAIFFAPTEEVSTSYAEDTHRMLQSVYRAHYTAKEHKEILQEMRVAKAGLAWTRVNESATTGAIYWYDPTPVHSNEQMTPTQLAELFSWLSEQFAIQSS
jgi:hypothetical protein